jgi:GT2 family glycosyltransferase
MKDCVISVIITVKNGQQTLGRCLDSILLCEGNNFEITVVDDGSIDNTAGILRQYGPKLRIITNEKNMGPAVSRNIAAASSKGGYLAFTDSDCSVDKYWLQELLSCFTGPDIAGAGGRQDMPEDESGFGRTLSVFFKSIGFAAEYLRGPESKSIRTDHNPSCNVMYRKEAFLQEGGFSDKLWTSEDVDLDYRLRRKGYSLVFNPRAIVYHYRPRSLNEFKAKMFRYGLAQGVLVRKYGFFRKIHYFFIASAVLFSILLFSFYFSPKTGLSLSLGLVFSLWIYFIYFIRKFTLAFYFLGIFFSLVFFWNTGFLAGIINPDLKKLKF